MECTKCKKLLSKKGSHFICQGQCGGTFHRACVRGLLADMKAGKTRIYCSNCEEEEVDCSEEECVMDHEQLLKEILEKVSVIPSVKKQLSGIRESISLLSDKYDRILSEQEILSTKFIKMESETESAIKTLKDEFSATTNFICAEQADLRARVDERCGVIKELESENTRLLGELGTIKEKLFTLEKVSRSFNIELQAVPERSSENVLVVFKRLCDVVNVPIGDNQITACRRVAKQNPSSNRPRNILVSLNTPRLRDTVLSATQRYNKSHPDCGINSTVLDIHGETKRIYVVEHLSQEQKHLHAATRKAAKEKQFKYVWVKYGRIYVRKNDTTSAIYIRNIDCLNKLE